MFVYEGLIDLYLGTKIPPLLTVTSILLSIALPGMA